MILSLLPSDIRAAVDQPNNPPDLLLNDWDAWRFVFNNGTADFMFHLVFINREPTLRLDTPLPAKFSDLRKFPNYCIWRYTVPDFKMKGKERVYRLGALSYKLADRLNGMRVYFDPLRCSCRHYVDYVIYGTTFGHVYSPTYLPMNSKCPLYKRLYSDSNIDEPFQLKDNVSVKKGLSKYLSARQSRLERLNWCLFGGDCYGGK